MKKIAISVAVLAVLAVWSGRVLADDGPSIVVSGFGTGAVTWTDTDQAEFARPNQLNGVKKDMRTGVDSNFGIQATLKFNDALSFTGQGLVRKNATDYYGAELAWAFAKYKFTEEFSVRVGRIGVPIYLISDFRNVGYANTFMRPPMEIYRQVNLNSLDGADVLWQHPVGESTLSAQFGTGHASVDNAGGSTIRFENVYSLNLMWETGPYTFRFGRSQSSDLSQLNVPALDSLLATLRSVGLGSVANQMGVTHVSGNFTSLGLIADYGNIVVQSEYAKRRTSTRVVGDTTSWYVLAGYRYGKFTPYLNYADTAEDSIRSMPGMPGTGPLAPLTAAVNSLVRVPEQNTSTLGLRWDFYKSAAFKVQWDHVKPKNGAGVFLKPAPGFTGPVNVYAAGVDFVF